MSVSQRPMPPTTIGSSIPATNVHSLPGVNLSGLSQSLDPQTQLVWRSKARLNAALADNDDYFSQYEPGEAAFRLTMHFLHNADLYLPTQTASPGEQLWKPVHNPFKQNMGGTTVPSQSSVGQLTGDASHHGELDILDATQASYQWWNKAKSNYERLYGVGSWGR